MTTEDKYYATTMRQLDDLDNYGSLYDFAPQRHDDQQLPRGSSNFFCRRFLWQMRQSNRRLSIRLLRWPKFIKFLLGLPMFSTWVLLPTTLTLLPLLPTLLPTLLFPDALFYSKNIP
jgi:hypothetical protein